MNKKFIINSVFVLSIATSFAQEIALNQIGFTPKGYKQAVVTNENKLRTFHLLDTETKEVVYTGELSSSKNWEYSNQMLRIAEFSDFQKEGSYSLKIGTNSIDFEIKTKIYGDVLNAACKAFYLNRASLDIEPKYAGVYARKGGHLDDHVLIHSSAASDGRPENTVVSSPGGWYDAGDYNKYIVNSGITTYTLLRAYDKFYKIHKKLDLNIPESDNKKADLLDEIEYNINWMITMQDPEDGGVYHKLTDKKFSGFVVPTEAVTPRYVVQKTTSAALNFSAVLAYYSILIKDKKRASKVLDRAKRAFEWAEKHPVVYYNQPEDIETGAYGDGDVTDEFFWARAELFNATKDTRYDAFGNDFSISSEAKWSYVKPLGLISLATSKTKYQKKAQEALVDYAEKLMKSKRQSANGTVMGFSKENFVWGSSAVAANQSMLLIEVFKLTKEGKYKLGALSNLNYLLGQNPLHYCYVTGFGQKSPQYIHHRLSSSDGVVEPQPGLLAGGPNYKQQDKKENITYPSDDPAMSYTDEEPSYASNEIAINWNAPLVYLLSFAESSK